MITRNNPPQGCEFNYSEWQAVKSKNGGWSIIDHSTQSEVAHCDTWAEAVTIMWSNPERK